MSFYRSLVSGGGGGKSEGLFSFQLHWKLLGLNALACFDGFTYFFRRFLFETSEISNCGPSVRGFVVIEIGKRVQDQEHIGEKLDLWSA